MIKLLLPSILAATLLNAEALKNDEFDTNKLGLTFEKFVIQTNKKFGYYDALKLSIISQAKQIEDLKKRVDILEQKQIVKLKSKKEDIKLIKPLNTNTWLVGTTKGIIAYLEPYSKDELYIKRYPYKTKLEIESCNKYGWCKIKDKDEYVAQYLLKKNENN